MRLTLVHTWFQFLETVRTPISIVGNCLFPALILLFFVVQSRFCAPIRSRQLSRSH